MAEFHKILKRQIAKYLGGQEIPLEMEALFNAINHFYASTDRDREMLERAMQISSQELLEANQKVREEFTQKLKAQEKALQNEGILESISRNVREAIYRRNLNGTMMYVNDAFVELFGYSSIQEVTGLAPEVFYENPDDRVTLIKRLKAGGIVNSDEVYFRKKDGSTFWGLVRMAIGKDLSGNNFIDGAIVDISALKRTEQTLRDTNYELEKVNEELDRFVYSASHDLRAPLMSILGLVNLIEKDEVDSPLPYLDKIKKSIARLDMFIREIIDYSQNARKELTMAKVNFNELINDCLEHLKFLDASDRIDKLVEVDVHTDFYSDRGRIDVILNNLISNAINYHNPNQKNPFFKIKVSTTPTGCLLEVGDNGVGIGTEHLDKIFNMFYRAHTTSSGSGLGLYIVKETVNKLQGSIHVHSSPGEGTSFIIELPSQAEGFEGNLSMEMEAPLVP